MKKGKYIIIEGIDGSGKTTQAAQLITRLNMNGHNSVRTQEPTDGPVGKLIRKILNGDIEIDKQIMGMLFVPDTYHNFIKEDGICHLLNRNVNVIADRSYISTMAYQSLYLPLDWIRNAHSLSMNITKPDIIFYLYADPSVCYERLVARGKKLQIHETLDNLQKVHERYLEVLTKFRHINTTHINTEAPIDHTAKIILRNVMEIL